MGAKAHNRETPRQKRIRNARRLLEQHPNNWDGSDAFARLIEAKWAVVVERSQDSWVLAADNLLDVAKIELGCLTSDGDDAEWVRGVFDLETGEPVPYIAKIVVEVKAEPYDGVTHRAQST